MCRACLAEFAGPPVVVEQLPAPLWSLGPYAGCRRAAILAWKSGDRRELAPVFAELSRAAGRALAREIGPAQGPVRGDTLFVVPAPSGLGRRLSGRLVVADVAQHVAAGLADGPAVDLAGTSTSRVVALDLLVRVGAHTQAGRGARARSTARRGRVAPLTRLPPGAPVLLVDDVLASGATLGACVDAVARAGGAVAGALVFAHSAQGRAAGRSGGGEPPGNHAVSPLENGARST